MTKTFYMTSVKRALRGVDRATRAQVLKDIEAHLRDFDGEDIVGHFGSADALVAQYLEDMDYQPSLVRKIFRACAQAGRAVLLGLGALVVAIIVAIWGLWWYGGNDDFDLADPTAPQLHTAGWQRTAYGAQSIAFDIRQGRLVLYWHDAPEVRWRCRGRNGGIPLNGQTFTLRHGRCLVFMPHIASKVEVFQGRLTVVRLAADTTIDSTQSTIRTVYDQAYRLVYTLNDSEMVGPIIANDTSPITVTLTAFQSKIRPYTYE